MRVAGLLVLLAAALAAPAARADADDEEMFAEIAATRQALERDAAALAEAAERLRAAARSPAGAPPPSPPRAAASRRQVLVHYSFLAPVTPYGAQRRTIERPRAPLRRWPDMIQTFATIPYAAQGEGRRVAPASGGRRDVFWIARLSFTVEHARQRLVIDRPELHMLRLRPGQDAGAAVDAVLRRAAADVGPDGPLRDIFVFHMISRGRTPDPTRDIYLGDPPARLVDFAMRREAGPYDGVDEARRAMASALFGLGRAERARATAAEESPEPLFVVWDNPEPEGYPDEAMYYVLFWDWGTWDQNPPADFRYAP